MTSLPDELWRQIIETGIRRSKWNFIDLCCVSMTCRRLHQIADEDSLWSLLLSADFPRRWWLPPHQNPSSSTILTPSSSLAKFAYKIRFERKRAKRISEAQQIAVLRKQNEVLKRELEIQNLQFLIIQLRKRLRETLTQLFDYSMSILRYILLLNQSNNSCNDTSSAVSSCVLPTSCRQAHTAALNVQQPGVSAVESRLTLETEHRFCTKQMDILNKKHTFYTEQVDGLNKKIRDEECTLQKEKEELEALKNQMSHDFSLIGTERRRRRRRRTHQVMD